MPAGWPVVLSWNCGGILPDDTCFNRHLKQRLEYLAYALQRYQVDLVLLQEAVAGWWAGLCHGVSDTLEFLRRRTGMTGYQAPAWRQWGATYHLALLSRMPLEEVTAATVGSRPVLLARDPEGRLYVNVHLDPRQALLPQMLRLQTLVAAQNRGLWLVGGDFNAPALQALLTEAGWHEARLVLPPRPTHANGCLDYLLLSPRWYEACPPGQGWQLKTLDLASDHLALLWQPAQGWRA